MKKLGLFSIMSLTLMAISISYLDFDDLNWENNVRAYIGLIFSVILFVINFIFNNKTN